MSELTVVTSIYRSEGGRILRVLCSSDLAAIRAKQNGRYIEETVVSSESRISKSLYCSIVYFPHHLQAACAFVAALLHYLFTTVFFWMLCEGIMLYLMLVLVFSEISKKWWIFFIIGWGKLNIYFSSICMYKKMCASATTFSTRFAKLIILHMS